MGRKKDVSSREASRVPTPKTKNGNSLPKIEPLPGTVCAQMVRCGRSNCKCAKGQLHGPYFYRFWYEGSKLRKEYVKKVNIQAVSEACLAFKRERRQARDLIRSHIRMLREFTALLREYAKL